MTKKSETEVAEVQDLTPMAMISQVIQNPDFDVDKLDKLMALQERWEDRQAAKQFNDAVSKFQSEVQAIPKSKKGVHDIKYAPLDTIMTTIQPVLAANGLSVRFSTDFPAEGLIRAICTVSHISGHSEQSEIAIPIDDKMSANSSQKMGSANSYAKRYALSNALNLAFVEHDDDADGLYERITDEQVANLEALIEEVEANKAGFLKFCNVKTLEDIPANKHTTAVRALEQKRKKAS